jgi:rRNA maturation protein Nop10
MVLCRKCANTVRRTTLRCPRCGWALPYYRSRRWKPRIPRAALFAAGKDCPRCGRRTERIHSPLWFRAVRVFAKQRASYRKCKGCRWQGASFHGRDEADPPAPRERSPRSTRGNMESHGA